MKALFTIAALAGVAFAPFAMTAANAQAAAAPAPAASLPPVPVAVFNQEAAVVNTAAYKAAAAQIQTTFKTQIAAYQTRGQALQAEQVTLRAEIETMQKNPATTKPALDAKIAAFQAKAQAAQAELNRLALPFARPDAYVKEQIDSKTEAALKAAMSARKVSLVISPEAVIAAQNAADITLDVVNQLNALVPSASITPPANWQPGQANQAAAAGR